MFFPRIYFTGAIYIHSYIYWSYIYIRIYFYWSSVINVFCSDILLTTSIDFLSFSVSLEPLCLGDRKTILQVLYIIFYSFISILILSQLSVLFFSSVLVSCLKKSWKRLNYEIDSNFPVSSVDKKTKIKKSSAFCSSSHVSQVKPAKSF